MTIGKMLEELNYECMIYDNQRKYQYQEAWQLYLLKETPTYVFHNMLYFFLIKEAKQQFPAELDVLVYKS